MKTLILNENQIFEAASILKKGELVAIPTETVYGLGADALNVEAIKKIFKIKNRPYDNPIIVHISKKEDVFKFTRNIGDEAMKLMDAFWPGPLTLILNKLDIIPNVTSGGLDTVAIRMPSLDITLNLIEALRSPIAAPSANISGRPSAVNASQVLANLDGLISAVIEPKNFSCNIGIESTVVDVSKKRSNIPVLLRPGIVTPSDIESVVGNLEIDPRIYGVYNLSNGDDTPSPGLKYKHYAPDVNITILKGTRKDYINFVNSIPEKDKDENAALCFYEDLDEINIKKVSYGPENNAIEQCKQLFSAFYELDSLGVKYAWARIPYKNFDGGMYLAVYNRLLRASSFRIKEIPVSI